MEDKVEGSNECKQGEEDGNKKPIPGCENVEDFVQSGFKCLINATKSSNRLPFGKARDYYETYPNFHSWMKKSSGKVLSQLSILLNHAGFRSNIQNRDDDDKIEMIIDSNNTLLGKVGRTLDELSGIIKYTVPKFESASNTQPVCGSWNIKTKGGKITAAQVLSEVLEKTKNIEKPQDKFKDKVKNDRNSIFEPKIKYKYNMLKPLAITEEIGEYGTIRYCHPYKFELEHFNPVKEQLQMVQAIPYKSLADTPFHFITKAEEVKQVVTDCKKYGEIGVDLEHHSYRSFQGFTCLMQISTRHTDYIIDTLVLRNDLQELNEVFTDPKIVKVIHGADSDLIWLQRDLGLYIVNLFDTSEAAKLLNYSRHSLAYLLHKFCGVDPEKHFQLADWRIRPLPEPMIIYARGDTHYLLYIYDKIKNALLEKCGGKTNYLEVAIANSTSKCLKQVYEQPQFNEDGYLTLYHKSKKLFDNRQKYALKCLYEWRDNIARTHDESFGYVLPNHMMLQISEALPREAQGILACCNPIPVLVRKYLLPLHQIILKARDQPLIEPIFKERQFYRFIAENNLAPNNPLNCPHDLNHESEFRDDLPVLLSNNSLLLNKDESLVNLKPIITIFEETNPRGDEILKSLKKRIMLTPYQRYKLTKPFSEKKEADFQARKQTAVNAEKVKMIEENLEKCLVEEEPEEVPVIAESRSSTKRKAEESNSLRSKKIKTDDNSDPVKYQRPKPKGEKNKRTEIQPFNYSSVDFGKFQTQAKSYSKKDRHRKDFGRKKN